MEEQTVKFINEIFEANAEIGNLLSVEYVIYLDFPDTIAGIVLNFERRVFTVKAVADDDTMEAIAGKIKLSSDQNLISASQDKPWSIAIGKSIVWSWALINQQGYPDAIQFEFNNNISGSSIIIQLITLASCMRIYELNEVSV